MMLHDVLDAGPKRVKRWRVGRGTGSGNGKTAGRGTKGAYSRSGTSIKLGFEGGTMRFFRRLPRRGFNNAEFRVAYQAVNVGALDKAFAAGEEITLAAVIGKGLVRRNAERIKVLGDGDVTKALRIAADVPVSAVAREKVAKAGGTVLAPPPPKRPPNFRRLEAQKLADQKRAAAEAAAAEAAAKGKGAKPAKAAKPEGGEKPAKAAKPEGGEKPAKAAKPEKKGGKDGKGES